MSFSSVQAAHDALVDALEGVDAIRVHPELADSADPPAAYVNPPELAWNAPGPEPTDGTWSVALVVKAGERTTSELYRLLPLVVAALEDVDDAVVRTAEPGTWTSGNTTLPCYFIRIEVAL